MAICGEKWWRFPKCGVKLLFYGEYQHSVDPKGRVIMPAKLREALGEKFMVTRGLDSCLFAYSQDGWGDLEKKLKELPLNDLNSRAVARFFFSGATECEVDKQGRILIPQSLREYACLEKDVIIAGVSDKVEIWDKDKWQSYMSGVNANPNAFAENIALLGIRI